MQRIRLAGPEALVGVVVLGLIAAMLALALVGTLVGYAAGAFPVTAPSLVGTVIIALAGAWFARSTLRSARLVRVVEVSPDGGWRLRGVLGNTVAQLPPGVPREVRPTTYRVWMFIGTANRYQESRAEIASGDRVWPTVRSTPRFQGPALEALRRAPR